MHATMRDVKYKNTAETFEAVFFVCFDSDTLSGHPKPANEGHLKTGQRE
jgi:hypothetical protein